MSNFTLVIPAKEESNSLPLVLDEIIKNYDLKFEIIVVVGKEDLTTINAINKYNCEVLIQSGKGYGNAIREGIKKVKTKYLAIFYADGSTDPKFLMPMLDKIINKDNSIIFGSRYEKNAMSYDDDIVTKIGNFIFTKIGNIFFSLKLTDLLFTYIVAEKDIMDKLNLKKDDYCLCVEIPINAKKLLINYTTHPCIERKRIADKKKVKAFKDELKILTYLFKRFLY